MTWQTDENPYFVDRCNDRIARCATIIIDLNDSVLVTSRFSDSPAREVVDRFLVKYSAWVNQVHAIYALGSRKNRQSHPDY